MSLQNMMKVLLVTACLPASAFASGTCSIRETIDVQGSHFQDSGRIAVVSEKEVHDLNECVEAGKELLGKKSNDRFTFTRKRGSRKTGQRTYTYTDPNATLMTVKVVLQYQDADSESRPVKIKFKYQ